jgi:hypothetical protein
LPSPRLLKNASNEMSFIISRGPMTDNLSSLLLQHLIHLDPDCLLLDFSDTTNLHHMCIIIINVIGSLTSRLPQHAAVGPQARRWRTRLEKRRTENVPCSSDPSKTKLMFQRPGERRSMPETTSVRPDRCSSPGPGPSMVYLHRYCDAPGF